MKNATGISRWTSAGRNHAVHILNDEGSLVLCKKQFFSHNTEALDVEKVTCKRCLSVFKNLNKVHVSSTIACCKYCGLPNDMTMLNCSECGESL